jgi:hypothetical protein
MSFFFWSTEVMLFVEHWEGNQTIVKPSKTNVPIHQYVTDEINRLRGNSSGSGISGNFCSLIIQK